DMKNKAKELWDKFSSNITSEKLKSILNKSKEILNLSSSAHLSKFLDKIQLMIDMIGDYINGNYKNIPWKTIASIAGALLYIIIPIDAIPDIIPIAGLIDDAFIIGLCLKYFSDDLNRYRTWKYGEDVVDTSKNEENKSDENINEAEYKILDDNENKIQ
ncbi:DUF1232 domain-containing protein, partial [Brachyspira sp. G79]|uniref:DUF1232 domain-containing protein n=1 Tax=Brachyspira sp. G79 TaxID=1358104 RepID=UPI000BBC6594